jgi:hypothetical protein
VHIISTDITYYIPVNTTLFPAEGAAMTSSDDDDDVYIYIYIYIGYNRMMVPLSLHENLCWVYDTII